MFKITLVNLSPDDLSANASRGQVAMGEVSDDQLAELLETLRSLPPMQVLEAEPQVIIEGRHGKHLVRTGQGKLFLYDARDTTKDFAELTSEEIVRHLSAIPAAASEDVVDLPETPSRTPHRGIAVAMLIAGLGLNGYTLYSVFYVDDVNLKPAITLITDATELSARLADVTGRYITGTEPGDRFILIRSDGTVHFGEISSGVRRPESDDTYRIGRHDDQLCLTTPDSGVIDVTGPNSLVYYRDNYRRAK